METPPSQPTLCGTDSRKFHDLSNGMRVDIRTDRMVVWFWFMYVLLHFQAIKKNMKKYTEQFEVMDRLRQSNVSSVSHLTICLLVCDIL